MQISISNTLSILKAHLKTNLAAMPSPFQQRPKLLIEEKWLDGEAILVAARTATEPERVRESGDAFQLRTVLADVGMFGKEASCVSVA